jgi:hypothetical protein
VWHLVPLSEVDLLLKAANVVVLDPDVARVFTDSELVNQALRALFPEPISELSAKARRNGKQIQNRKR